MANATSFAEYPEAVKAADTGYDHSEGINPVLRGIPLAIGAALVTRSSMLQRYIWTNAGFGTTKDMRILDDIPARLQPTVTPLGDSRPLLDFEPELLTAKFTSSKGRYYTASDYHEMYKAGTVTPSQVVEALLPLIKQGQKPPGQYEDAWADSHGVDHLALEAAAASTKRYASGASLGVLDGVPIGIKDDFDVKGYVTHVGLKYDPSQSCFKPQEDTLWPVKKLQEAGAVVLGKNRMHELGTDTNGLNVAQGTPTNHYNTSYYPGGSTSGGGSALGAGTIPICLGSDAGGSGRFPAAYNGVYGLKTSKGRIAQTQQSSVGVSCPLAASVADLTISYRIMSQPDPSSSVQSLFATSKPPSAKGGVLGVFRDWWKGADAPVVDACDRAVNWLAKERGYKVVDISIPYIAEARTAHGGICVTELAESARRRADDPSRYLELVGPANKLIMAISSQTTGADYLKYNMLREVMMRHLAHLFQKNPGLLIVTPTSPMVGWPRSAADEAYGASDTNRSLKSMMYVFLANLTGTPSLSGPVGYVEPEQGEGKMPIGLMATGEWGSEEQLLAWAGELEEYLYDVYEGGRKKPKTWLDVLELAKEKNEEA